MKTKTKAKQPQERPFNPVVVSDFDGTISQIDVTDQILTQLAHPSWREVEQEWALGTIGSRECLERQIALVQASADELNAVIDTIELDPGFAALCQFAQQKHVPFYIASDGFDYVIHRVLKGAGLARRFRKNVYASALRVEGRRLLPSFPQKPCEHGCATCKVALLNRLREDHQPIIFVGDGMSDRYAFEAADVVFAKRQLLAYCREKGIVCHAFETLRDVQGHLEKLLAPAPARRVRQAIPAVS